MLEFLIDNIYIRVGKENFREQVVELELKRTTESPTIYAILFRYILITIKNRNTLPFLIKETTLYLTFHIYAVIFPLNLLMK